MRRTSSEIDVEIDLRVKCPPVRDQGKRSTCLACAASDAHMQTHSLREALSAEFLFYHAAQHMPGKDARQGITFQAAREALRTPGQPLEREWPYHAVQPNPWTPPVGSAFWRGDCSISITRPATEIAKFLRQDCPVVLGIKLTLDFIKVRATPAIISARGIGFGGHAVLAVGLGRLKTGPTLLLVRNSWGEGWGDRGYAWLPSRYLAKKLIGYGAISAL